MKTFLFFLFLIPAIASAQFTPETDPHRGMYVDGFVRNTFQSSQIMDPGFSILGVDENSDGIFEKEDELLQYACENHITYLAMYNWNTILGRNLTAWNENTKRYENLEEHLCRFITKAKTQYGVTQIGAIGGSANSFDSIRTYMDRYPVTSPYRLRNEITNSPHFDTSLYVVERDLSENDPDIPRAELLKMYLRTMDFNMFNQCQADIDVINVEYEFWFDCGNDINNFMNILYSMRSLKNIYNQLNPNNPIFTEAYLAMLNYYCSNPGFMNTVKMFDGCNNCAPCATCQNPHESLVDRVLYSMLINTPIHGFNWQVENGFEDAVTSDSTDYHPMFYSEGSNSGGLFDYLGPWLNGEPFNTIFIAEDYYFYHWLMLSGANLGQPRQNDIQAGGAHWFTASHMVGVLDDPEIIQTYGPVCAGSSGGMIDFRYLGPDEPGTDFSFRVTKKSDGTVMYPVNGTSITGTSVSNIPNPALRAIDFTDTTVFPVCILPPGDYIAELSLHYQNGTGCSYTSTSDLVVDVRPRLQISGDSSFCEGSQSFLLATQGANGYSWYRNGQFLKTTGVNWLRVTEDGDFSCTLAGGSCTGTTDTLHIHVRPNPAVEANAHCNGNGSVTLRTNVLPADPASNNIYGAGGATYLWNTGATTDQITVSGSLDKTYRVVVTNPYSGCTRTRVVEVKDSLINPSAVITVNAQPSGPCANDGSLTATVVPTPGPYDKILYLWSNGETTQTINNLPPGDYSVVISIYRTACSAEGTITLGSAPTNGPTVSETITPVSCHGKNDGAISLSLSGGNSPFTYFWQDIPDTDGYDPANSDQQNLYPGIYTLEITDANGCLYTYSYTVPVANPDIEITVTNIDPVTSCWNGSDGSATVSVSGGNSPYQVNWNDAQSQAGFTANNLPAGTVEVTATDQNGCVAQKFVHIPADEEPFGIMLLDSSLTDLGCDSLGTGMLYVEIYGGTEPYSVNNPWQTDSNFVWMQSAAPGGHSLTVTDQSGCIVTDSFNVILNMPLVSSTVIHTNCIGCNDGSISLLVQSGTPPYMITLTPPAGNISGNTISQLPAGTYDICVTDTNGCQVCITEVVQEDPTGLHEVENISTLLIYPNPARSEVIVQSASIRSARVTVYDMSGRLLLLKEGTGRYQLDVKGFSAGCYFIFTEDRSGRKTGSGKLFITG